MTKRIVSGIFILAALGALGVILAGALTSGEQLIVRFLTAVIVAGLGLYVISDLRLQATEDEAERAARQGMRTMKAPANSTAEFMATVSGRSRDRVSHDQIRAEMPAPGADDDTTPFGDHRFDALDLGAGGLAATATDSDASSPGLSLAVNPSPSVAVADELTMTRSYEPDTADDRSIGLANNDRNGHGPGARSIPDPIQFGLDAPVENSTDEHAAIGAEHHPAADHDPTANAAAADAPSTDTAVLDTASTNTTSTNTVSNDTAGPAPLGATETGGDAEFYHYSGELDGPLEQWPPLSADASLTRDLGPFSTPIAPVERFDGPDALLGTETAALAAMPVDASTSEPVDPGPSATTSAEEPVAVANGAFAATDAADWDDEVIELDGSPAPVIDLRGIGSLADEASVDTAIRAGEIEVVKTLIEQGMLSTSGPITDRDVRTMVYVAFTSNELRKLIMAGGSPEGPNRHLDLGPVELFDERKHAPVPQTYYTGLLDPAEAKARIDELLGLEPLSTSRPDERRVDETSVPGANGTVPIISYNNMARA